MVSALIRSQLTDHRLLNHDLHGSDQTESGIYLSETFLFDQANTDLVTHFKDVN